MVFYKYFVNTTWVDNAGDETNLRVEVDGGVAGAELQGNTDTIIDTVQALTGAVLKGFQIESVYREDALTLPLSGVQIEEKALISMRLSTFAKTASIAIPAPLATIFVGTSGKNANIVDDGVAGVQDLVDMFVAATGAARISDGETTLAYADGGFIEGKRIHRASRKG